MMREWMNVYYLAVSPLSSFTMLAIDMSLSSKLFHLTKIKAKVRQNNKFNMLVRWFIVHLKCKAQDHIAL